MIPTQRGLRLRLILALIGVALLSAPLVSSPSPGAGLPEEIGDGEFWKIISEFSEPDGAWRNDSFMSNEASSQTVIPTLRELVPSGGVYLGVGPEQNFTYIAALKSRLAFVMDARRQNMLELLMYKAIFELSPTRADFVARLFVRKRPAGLEEKASVAALFAAYRSADRGDLALNLQEVRSAIFRRGFPLSSEDLFKIGQLHQLFAQNGPSMTAEITGGKAVTYEQLMTATDAEGRLWSYLSSEEAYRHVREMQQKNLIIPIVGDFLGPVALRSIGLYLEERKASVSAFYVSNVEMGLDGPQFRDFHASVAVLPLTSSSMFIRWAPPSSTQYLAWYRPNMGPAVMTLASISRLIDLFMTGSSPASWAETLQGTKEPAALLRAAADPSLRRVVGRVLGTARLKPDESLRVELVESPRGSGLIFDAPVRSDGSFEFLQVQPRVYEAIVLKTCKACGVSTGLGSPVRVVIANKDVSGLKLVVPSR